jgi:hypothetical protein
LTRRFAATALARPTRYPKMAPQPTIAWHQA